MHRTALALAFVLASASTAAADGSDFASSLFSPDVTASELAEELTVGAESHTALPGVAGFWTDLVDTENVSATGAGVYVAVLDTGLLPHAPFFFSQANIAWHLGVGFSHDLSWDDDFGIVVGPLRDDRGYITDLASGHGTHVTSTIAGFNVNGDFWVNGVAPEATIIPVLVLDAWQVDSPFGPLQLSGGTDEMVAAGILYVADLADTLDGPVVINMSLGGPDKSPMIEAAIDYAIGKGVIVVASAGNSGTTGMGYPGGLEQVISAGAAGWATMWNAGWSADVPEKLNKRDLNGNASQLYLEDFSSRPNKDLAQKHQDLDVSAPGAWIVGPYQPAFSQALAYYYLSGTSMASPHVAAIAALVLESHPALTQAQMEHVLERAAAGHSLPASDAWVTFPFTDEGGYPATWDGGDYGKGFLQADAAIDAASH